MLQQEISKLPTAKAVIFESEALGALYFLSLMVIFAIVLFAIYYEFKHQGVSITLIAVLTTMICLPVGKIAIVLGSQLHTSKAGVVNEILYLVVFAIALGITGCVAIRKSATRKILKPQGGETNKTSLKILKRWISGG